MGLTYGKSTYSQLIDEVRHDLNLESELAGLTDEAIQRWVLEAEREICQLVEVEEEYDLGINTDVTEYFFQDRPAITAAADNGSGLIRVTAAAHGLVDGDIVFITGVLGTTEANGRFYVDVNSSSTFDLYEVFDIEGATNATPIVVTTTEAHGLSDADAVTISGVLGNTAANATSYVDVTGVKTFALYSDVGLTTEVAGNGAYTSGGIARHDSAFATAWTSGGRFWRDDEVPTWVKLVKRARRPWGNYFPKLEIYDNDSILDSERWQNVNVYSQSADWAPAVVSHNRRDGRRFLKFYPTPSEDKTVRLFCSMQIQPLLYLSDPLTTTIHLEQKYDPAIKAWVRAKMLSWAKFSDKLLAVKEQKVQIANAEFQSKMIVLRQTPKPSRMRVTYS